MTSSLMEPNDGRRLLVRDWEAGEWDECGDESLELSWRQQSATEVVVKRDRAGLGREAAEGAAKSMMATGGEQPPLKMDSNGAIDEQHNTRGAPS